MSTLLYTQKARRRYSSKSCKITGRSGTAQPILPEMFDPCKMAKLIQMRGRVRSSNHAAKNLNGGLIKEIIVSLVSQSNGFNPIYLVCVQGAFLPDGMGFRWDHGIIREYHFGWEELVLALRDKEG